MLSDSIQQAMKHKNQFYFDLLNIENEDLQYRIEKDINRTYLVKLDKVSKEYRNSNFLEFRDKKKYYLMFSKPMEILIKRSLIVKELII